MRGTVGDQETPDLARNKHSRKFIPIAKELLVEMYENQRMSAVDIAKSLNTSCGTVYSRMESFGIQRRSPIDAGKLKSKTSGVYDDYFQVVDTHDKAYIVGFILGDGHLTVADKNRRAKRVQIILAEEDVTLLESISLKLSDKNLVRVRENSAISEQRKANLIINSTQMVNDLVKVGIPLGKKSTKEPFIQLDTPELIWSLLRGMSDADGCIRHYSRTSEVKGKLYTSMRVKWTITTGEPFLRGLVQFFLSEGIELTPKCVKPHSGTYVIEVSHRKSIRVIRDHMYKNGSLWLQRKKDVFDSI